MTLITEKVKQEVVDAARLAGDSSAAFYRAQRDGGMRRRDAVRVTMAFHGSLFRGIALAGPLLKAFLTTPPESLQRTGRDA